MADEGKRRILVIDDEAIVRRIVVRSLSSAGFDVCEAGTVDAALAHVDGEGRIDAVVSDVMMPELLGPELLPRLRAARPGLPVLFVSGLSDGHGVDLEPGKTAFLAKPFGAPELVAAVRALLDAG